MVVLKIPLLKYFFLLVWLWKTLFSVFYIEHFLKLSVLFQIKVSTQQLCPGEGHYPYKSGCNSVFYNCKRNSRNDLQGYLYKCPENFLYWSVSRRCEREARLPLCGLYKSKENENWQEKWQIPVEESNLSARSLFL